MDQMSRVMGVHPMNTLRVAARRDRVERVNQHGGTEQMIVVSKSEVRQILNWCAEVDMAWQEEATKARRWKGMARRHQRNSIAAATFANAERIYDDSGSPA